MPGCAASLARPPDAAAGTGTAELSRSCAPPGGADHADHDTPGSGRPDAVAETRRVTEPPPSRPGPSCGKHSGPVSPAVVKHSRRAARSGAPVTAVKRKTPVSSVLSTTTPCGRAPGTDSPRTTPALACQIVPPRGGAHAAVPDRHTRSGTGAARGSRRVGPAGQPTRRPGRDPSRPRALPERGGHRRPGRHDVLPAVLQPPRCSPATARDWRRPDRPAPNARRPAVSPRTEPAASSPFQAAPPHGAAVSRRLRPVIVSRRRRDRRPPPVRDR
ncbi:hypothetical protein J2S47_000568 [Streptomyces griseoviridis]|uniref:Uncharacterized protein n=1 Tax=Streptomyces griseoviridis TaxID=45398 RepID=A0ABT9L8N1_STRGD|nr:hypothetical protein [Streptomyces griseoviridis]